MHLKNYFRKKLAFKLNSAPKKHEDKVQGIQKQVREYQTRGDGRKGMFGLQIHVDHEFNQ